ncbi:unnamed protein product, partial [Brugia pahangi]|uniref:Heat shock protein 70 n=1 Tax=Brugia pahangi TaxID=6280 RepID=A0A0N4TG77_BRUPA
MKTLPLFLTVALLVVDVFSRQGEDGKKDDVHGSDDEKSAKYGTIIGIDLGTTY